MTIREVLAEASAVISSLDASLLLASVLHVNRSSLIAAGGEPLGEASLSAFRALIQRRLDGECVAYIVGRKEFYGLDFVVSPAVLVPRPDTETLVEAALDFCREWGKTVRVLDLGTGSGAIAIALKHTIPELEVWATDISAEALAIAQANAARLLPPNSIHFYQGDLYKALPYSLIRQCRTPTPYSLHISNAPYIPTAEIAGLAPEVQREPLIALDGGSDGLGIIGRIISGAPQFLCPGGALMLEADPRQMERIVALLRQTGFTDIHTRRDLSGNERVITAKK